ncbi:MAG: hypothetical protein WBJ35_01070 [Acetomicrobium sp.]|uniref:hypothetical protein n=1 Tax=Acetomicrobium TaxID=49894 RepID=UPI002B2641CC|nr:hypothetical protein [Acetomicrobium sp.]HPU69423.1 hypothetical protein [Acetomicrobium flavidum]
MEVTINSLCEIVLKRLSMPRVGMVWSSPPTLQWKPRGEITLVHYLPNHFRETFEFENNPSYLIESITNPRREAKTLSALVVPMASLQLISELCLGFPFSPAGSLIYGCLDEQLPVIIDDSNLRCGFGLRNCMAHLQALDKISSRLCDLGFVMVLKDNLSSGISHNVMEICEKGWISWCELAGRLSGVNVIVLKGGARLTDEAKDRLRSLRIRIEEDM